MRRLLLATAILGLAAATSAATPDAKPPAQARPTGAMPVLNPNADAGKDCPVTNRYDAERNGGRLGPRKLTDLPDATAYAAVYRRIDGCEVPIVVEYNIGRK